MYDIERLRRAVKMRLTDSRYRHSLAVQRRAAQLAAMHGADWYRAAVAGLVHDICHCDTKDEQLKYLRAHGILLDAFYRRHPQIWHAVTGAVYLREELRIADREILRAVRYHTTGCAGMSALEKVVYLADATSADRTYPGVEDLRALADADLDRAVYRALHHTVSKLVQNGQVVVQDAWDALRYYSNPPGE